VHPDARVWRGGDSHTEDEVWRERSAGARGGGEIRVVHGAAVSEQANRIPSRYDAVNLEQMRPRGWLCGRLDGGTFSGVARF